jgi:hypothetical protein
MLDPAMRAFADEMRARPRPRRASTHRAEQIDNVSAPGAQRLSEMIRSFWSAAGFSNVETQINALTDRAVLSPTFSGSIRRTIARRFLRKHQRAAGRGIQPGHDFVIDGVSATGSTISVRHSYR